MGKLIDVDDLKRDLLERGFYPVIVKNALESAPEAVVRCKDCKRCDGFPEKEIEENEVGLCRRTGLLVFADFYCNVGKRRRTDE